MAKKKKQVDWPKIKARYLKGEKPKSIAEDYEGLTAKKVSKKADQEAWKGKKEEIKEKVAEKTEKVVLSSLAAFKKQQIEQAKLWQEACTYALSMIINKIKDTDNPYRQDGDGLVDFYIMELLKGNRDASKAINAELAKDTHGKNTGSSAQSEHVGTLKNSLSTIWGNDGS